MKLYEYKGISIGIANFNNENGKAYRYLYGGMWAGLTSHPLFCLTWFI